MNSDQGPRRRAGLKAADGRKDSAHFKLAGWHLAMTAVVHVDDQCLRRTQSKPVHWASDCCSWHTKNQPPVPCTAGRPKQRGRWLGNGHRGWDGGALRAPVATHTFAPAPASCNADIGATAFKALGFDVNAKTGKPPRMSSTPRGYSQLKSK